MKSIRATASSKARGTLKKGIVFPRAFPPVASPKNPSQRVLTGVFPGAKLMVKLVLIFTRYKRERNHVGKRDIGIVSGTGFLEVFRGARWCGGSADAG